MPEDVREVVGALEVERVEVRECDPVLVFVAARVEVCEWDPVLVFVVMRVEVRECDPVLVCVVVGEKDTESDTDFVSEAEAVRDAEAMRVDVSAWEDECEPDDVDAEASPLLPMSASTASRMRIRILVIFCAARSNRMNRRSRGG